MEYMTTRSGIPELGNMTSRSGGIILLLAVLPMTAALISATQPFSHGAPVHSEDDISALAECADCHEDQDAQVTHSGHRNVTLASGESLTCLSCHLTGAASHVESPKRGNIAVSYDNETCGRCHTAHLEMDNTGFDPHTIANINCGDCHKAHASTNQLVSDEKYEFCGKCHASALHEFNRASRHPLNSGGVTCLSCHNFTGKNGPTFAAGADENCVSCHPEVAGPYQYEHNATSGFTTEGDGCISCHSPHGSSHETLLVRSGDALCRQCHAIPPRHLTAHQGIGVNNRCADCHTTPHGSHDNRGLLDPDLGLKVSGSPGSCFCHNVEG